jgi:protoporphyrinogen oxidase
MNIAPSMCPAGKSSLYAEIAYRQSDAIDKSALIAKSIDDLIAAGILHNREEIVAQKVFDMNYAYVVYDDKHKNAVRTIKAFLKTHDIFPIGRYGAWEYSAMEEAMVEGRDLARQLA